jgi:hypothetical protein
LLESWIAKCKELGLDPKTGSKHAVAGSTGTSNAHRLNPDYIARCKALHLNPETAKKQQLCGNRKSTAFSPEEDARLRQLAAANGNKVKRIFESHFVGRTYEQLRGRFEHLRKSNNEPFSPEEDDELQKLVSKHGNNFVTIALEFDALGFNRTNYQLNSRYHNLTGKEEASKKRRSKKEAEGPSKKARVSAEKEPVVSVPQKNEVKASRKRNGLSDGKVEVVRNKKMKKSAKKEQVASAPKTKGGEVIEDTVQLTLEDTAKFIGKHVLVEWDGDDKKYQCIIRQDSSSVTGMTLEGLNWNDEGEALIPFDPKLDIWSFDGGEGEGDEELFGEDDDLGRGCGQVEEEFDITSILFEGC